MLNDKKKAVIGDLLYRAYMIDAITDAEVRQACAMLEIKYPPSLLENKNVGEQLYKTCINRREQARREEAKSQLPVMAVCH